MKTFKQFTSDQLNADLRYWGGVSRCYLVISPKTKKIRRLKNNQEKDGVDIQGEEKLAAMIAYLIDLGVKQVTWQEEYGYREAELAVKLQVYGEVKSLCLITHGSEKSVGVLEQDKLSSDLIIENTNESAATVAHLESLDAREVDWQEDR